jgi:hypothetical protein
MLSSFRGKVSTFQRNYREASMPRSSHTEAQMNGAVKQLEAGREAEDMMQK